jgi:hypothetical protein
MNPVPTATPKPTLPTAPAQVPVAPQPQLAEEDLAILQASLTDQLKEREQDILAFWRELPRLLAAGEEGRYAIVHDGRVESLWDSYDDARQAALDKYGLDGRFSTPLVRQRELDRLKALVARQRATGCP